MSSSTQSKIRVHSGQGCYKLVFSTAEDVLAWGPAGDEGELDLLSPGGGPPPVKPTLLLLIPAPAPAPVSGQPASAARLHLFPRVVAPSASSSTWSTLPPPTSSNMQTAQTLWLRLSLTFHAPTTRLNILHARPSPTFHAPPARPSPTFHSPPARPLQPSMLLLLDLFLPSMLLLLDLTYSYL